MRRALCIVAVLGLCATGANANLLQNPGFEQAAGAPIPNWPGVGQGPGFIPFSADSAVPPHGGSLDGSHIDFGGNPDNGYIYQQVTVSNGASLDLSAWRIWYSGGAEPDAWHTLEMGIDPTGGTDWNGANVVKTTAGPFSRSGWQQISLNGVVSQGTTATVFLFSGMQDANAAWWAHAWDDVDLTPEPATLAMLGLGGLVILRRRR